jgi:hypothetical protein
MSNAAMFAAVLVLGKAVRSRRALDREDRLLVAEQQRSERLLLNVLPAPIAARLKGDTVNTASRMESTGVPGCIQVTERTYQRLRDGYRFQRRGPIQVRAWARWSPGSWSQRTDDQLGRLRSAEPRPPGGQSKHHSRQIAEQAAGSKRAKGGTAA